MACKIDQGQRDVFARLLNRVCERYSEGPLCNVIKEAGCLGDGFYLLNGEGREFNISKAANMDGPIVQKRYRLFGREFELPVRTSKTQRYSIFEYVQPTVDEGRLTGSGSASGDALFCLVPIIGWILCASGCSGSSDTMPEPHIMDADNFPLMDVWLDVPIDASGTDDGTGAEGGIGDPADDVADAGAQGPDTVDVQKEETAQYELPGYDAPPNTDDAWQSSYETLGLCFNEATSCTKPAESGCWNINEMNTSKPNTLAFLDPAFDSMDIKLEGGPNNVSSEQTFERVEAGTVMENGYFDSTIWKAPGLLMAADCISDTVNIMLIRLDYNAGDLSVCEYIYNYPCSGADSCN